MAETKRARLANGVSEAGAAQVDGKHARLREPLRGLDRVLPGAAAGDEDIDAALRQGCANRRCWKLAAQIPVDRHRLADRCRLDPARVGHVLVLALNLARDVVLDRSEC